MFPPNDGYNVHQSKKSFCIRNFRSCLLQFIDNTLLSVEPLILSAGPHSDRRAKRKSHIYQNIICVSTLRLKLSARVPANLSKNLRKTAYFCD